MSDHDVTDRVMQVAGHVKYPGKFEGGTRQDELVAIMDADDSFGTIEHGAWYGFYTFTDNPDDFLLDLDQMDHYDTAIAMALARFVRSAVLKEDDLGFIYVTYFDSVEQGRDYFDSIQDELYPVDDEGNEILREID